MGDGNCPSCNKPAGSGTIMCKVCKLWIHKNCSGLTAEVWTCYTKLSDMGHKDVFTCNCCSAAWSKMEQRIADTAAEVEKLKATTKEQGEKIEEHDVAIKDVREEIKKINVDGVADKVAKEAASTAIQEIAEIESRKNNLTIFRLKEVSKDIKEGPKRKEGDMNLLKKVLSAIDCEAEFDTITTIFRPGKQPTDDDKPRPLTIILGNSIARNKILSNTKKLMDSEFKNISIQPDLTPRQRQHDRDLWREAEEKNKEMDAEEAKNYVFKPWGPPGMKKLRKLKRIQNKRQRSESPGAVTEVTRKRGRPLGSRNQT